MTFFDKLEPWFLQTQRDLPWRFDRTPYRVWLSEIMLQQTQVVTVIDYYQRFIAQFPTLQALAKAPEDRVLALWSGLGYYSRARNLHKTAKIITENHAGVFPDTYEALQKLPGIGSYTAGAILAFAFQKPAPVIDGNIMRVFSRLFNDFGDKKHFESISLELARKAPNILTWQEGLMELGALICKPVNPDCFQCPFGSICEARRCNTIEKLPIKLTKPEKTRLDIVCALIYDSEYLWLEKNHDNDLFKGLYMPPHLMTTPDKKALDFEKILSVLKLPAPKSSRFLTIQRTLTHRNLYLHAKLISMPRNSSKYWMKRSELNKIGLSAAIKSLLAKAALFGILLVPIACSHKSASIRYVQPYVQSVKPIKRNPTEYAKSLIGLPYAVLNNKEYRADCSGTIKAIYDAAGLSFGNIEGTDAIYNYIQKKGTLDMNKAHPGDLVFFNAGDKKKLNHIGFVEDVLADDTILFIHHMSGLIIRSRMNLKKPKLQIDPQTQTRLNHVLKRVNSKKSYTAGQLFAGFGRL